MKPQILAITCSPSLANQLRIGETSFLYGKSPQSLKCIPALETDIECFAVEGLLIGDLWVSGHPLEE